MANTAAITASFRAELFRAEHKFSNASGHQFKFALYASTATLGASTTAYSTTGELAASGNYTQGGVIADMTNNPASATSTGNAAGVGYWSPGAAASWGTLSQSNFDTALLWNASHAASAAVAVFTFGNQVVTAGNFSLSMPAHSSTAALLRIA